MTPWGLNKRPDWRNRPVQLLHFAAPLRGSSELCGPLRRRGPMQPSTTLQLTPSPLNDTKFSPRIDGYGWVWNHFIVRDERCNQGEEIQGTCIAAFVCTLLLTILSALSCEGGDNMQSPFATCSPLLRLQWRTCVFHTTYLQVAESIYGQLTVHYRSEVVRVEACSSSSARMWTFWSAKAFAEVYFATRVRNQGSP